MRVCPQTLSNMYISETNGPITVKFYLKHHRYGGKAALGFGPDQNKTLVSMATDSYHREKMGKILWPLKCLYFGLDLLRFCR